MKEFRGKVAAITGAGSGIGRALALHFAKEGTALALADVDERGLEETRSQLIEHGVKVTTKRVDVSDRTSVYAFADDVVRDHGTCHLVFNNAGISYAGTVEGTDYPDFERVMGVNFWGVVYGTKAFMPILRASGEGHVVNISSLFGLLSFPGQCAYNASKFAVRGFTECLREELDLTHANVSATVVHPGGIKTNIAKNSIAGESLRDFGLAPADAIGEFEKQFRTSAEDAAKVIARGVRRNARRVLIGADAYLSEGLQRMVPSAYQAVLIAAMRQSIAAQKRRALRTGIVGNP